MSNQNCAIEIEDLSKLYELGSINVETLQDALKRRWYRLLGKEHLMTKLGVKKVMIDSEHPQAGPYPNTFWALKDLNLTINQGEVMGVIGRNGAGKSTFLKLLSRITDPTYGRIRIRGRVASLLEIGTGFHPDLTGRENIYLNGAILGMRKSEIDRKYDEIVEFSQIERFMDTPVKRYSSGMYVRLAFSVAAHLEPEIFLVDEVLAVGDLEFQAKCLGRMGEVAKSGRTVLFVSHNMNAVRNLCDRTALLSQGRLVNVGSAEEIVSQYLSSYTDNVCGEWTWEDIEKAPGDDNFRVRSLRIRNGSGDLISQVPINEDILVEIEFDALRTVKNGRIGFRMLSPDAAVIFEALDGGELHVDTLRPQGRWLSRFHIPSGLMNSGTHYIMLAGEIPGMKYIFSEETHFPLTITETVESGKFGRRPGVIRPRIECQTIDLSIRQDARAV